MRSAESLDPFVLTALVQHRATAEPPQSLRRRSYWNMTFYAEAKKMRSRERHNYGCLKTSLTDRSSSHCFYFASFSHFLFFVNVLLFQQQLLLSPPPPLLLLFFLFFFFPFSFFFFFRIPFHWFWRSTKPGRVYVIIFSNRN